MTGGATGDGAARADTLPGLAHPGPRRAHLMAAAGGGLAALGQEPFGLWLFTPIGLAAALLAVSAAPGAGAAARRAWTAGTAYFALALHWIVEPFLVEPELTGWMAPFGLFFMAGGLALFWGAAGWFAGRLSSGAWRIVAFAALLAMAEFFRAFFLTGFPWAHPGHALIDTHLLVLASFAGPHGMTALILTVAAAVALAPRTGRVMLAPVTLALLWAVGTVLPEPEAPDPGPDAPIVRLVQPNAPQHLKWREDMIPVFFDRALALTQSGDGTADLVIWPEMSVAAPLDRAASWRVEISASARGAPVIAGSPRQEAGAVYNTLAVIEPGGGLGAIYDKHHLVPFGEYMPARELFEGWGIGGLATRLAGGFSPGPGTASLDLGPLGTAFPMICYEAIFPQYIRSQPRPDWLLHLTNDAWFGEFSGPYQHLALARLRAAEQGLPLLRAANTGVSAAIDARGRIVAAVPLGQAGALDVQLPAALPPTPYARAGDWPAVAFMLLAFLTAISLPRFRD